MYAFNRTNVVLKPTGREYVSFVEPDSFNRTNVVLKRQDGLLLDRPDPNLPLSALDRSCYAGHEFYTGNHAMATHNLSTHLAHWRAMLRPTLQGMAALCLGAPPLLWSLETWANWQVRELPLLASVCWVAGGLLLWFSKTALTSAEKPIVAGPAWLRWWVAGWMGLGVALASFPLLMGCWVFGPCTEVLWHSGRTPLETFGAGPGFVWLSGVFASVGLCSWLIGYYLWQRAHQE